MGGEEDGEIIFLPDLVQHIQQQMLSPHIDPGQRLVQNENLRNGLQRQGQQHPLELPAGEGADALLNQRLTVDPGQALGYLVPQMAGDRQENRPAADGGGEEIQDTDGIAPVETGALGDVADFGVGGISPGQLKLDRTGVGNLAQDAAEQGGLPGAIGADQGHDFPAVELEGDIPQDALPLQGHAQVADLEPAGPRFAGHGDAAVVLFGKSHAYASRRVLTLVCSIAR